MLFPGAIYFVSLGLIVGGIGVCMLVGCGVGTIVHATIPHLIYKTKGYKRYIRGVEVPARCWYQERYWFGFGFAIGCVITAYSIAGPIVTLIKYLGD